MSEYEENKWYRDSDIVFELKDAGFRRGKQVFQNKNIIKFEGDDKDTLQTLVYNLLSGDKVETFLKNYPDNGLRLVAKSMIEEYIKVLREVK